MAPDFLEGCAPLSVSFNNLSWPIDSTYEINWDFGDNVGFSNEISPNYIYQNEGDFSLFVSTTSSIGCYIDTTFSNLIKVESKPIADFSYEIEKLNNQDNKITISDFSERAVTWDWFFDDIVAPHSMHDQKRCLPIAVWHWKTSCHTLVLDLRSEFFPGDLTHCEAGLPG